MLFSVSIIRTLYWAFSFILVIALLPIPSSAEPPANDLWANRNLELAVKLLQDDQVPDYVKDHVRNFSAHELASYGFKQKSLSLIPTEMTPKAAATRTAIASGLAFCGDPEGAFEVAEPLTGNARQRALELIAVERAQVGDVASTRQALAKIEADAIDPAVRDNVREKVAERLSDFGELDEARRLADLIGDQTRRSQLKKRIEDVGRLLSPEEPGYFDQRMQSFLKRDLSDESMRYLRAFTQAEVAGSEGNVDFAREQLQKALSLDHDRLKGLLRIGAIAEKAGIQDLAQTCFRRILTIYLVEKQDIPRMDSLSLFWITERQWKSVGRTLPAEEIQKAIQQAHEMKNMEELVAILFVSLSNAADEETVEKEYQTLDTTYQRWLTSLRMLNRN
ncbi:hypothetical protein [Blastopirellula marina]|uniref:Uncharacterized protein n=1 Tax=Blastopirellula marina TaxID=124 RepID=A0A2S8FLS0_9BACT|nr:hypothetical protein [Blastopirellula marina]PQO33113.1 hypothetical protein C5Y98_18455 [Blastopirellula marina]PTL43280.1 hypothetical protein C5Y97_18465 [Blastopirellula marina]